MIDYCTFMIKEKERPLLIKHLSSLRSMCPGVFNVKVSTADIENIPEADEVVKLPFYKQECITCMKLAGYDSANRIDHIIRRCESQWVVVAHSDIVYISSLINPISGFMRDGTGMIGIWPHGLTVINRDIYLSCHAGFWPIFGLHLASNDNLVGLEDRLPDCRLVASLDVSELLRIEMQGLGYHCVGTNDFSSGSVYRHIGGGSCGR